VTLRSMWVLTGSNSRHNRVAYFGRSNKCQWYEKRDEKSDSRAAKKGAKKIVSSDFAEILE
jgi:hypothetical protein